MKKSTHGYSGLTAVLISLTLSAFIAGCDSDDNDNNNGPLPSASGVTFSDTSEELAPWQRGSGEGYGGMAWLDYDNDDDLDLMLTNEKNYSNALMRNNGDGTFTDVTIAANAVVMTGSSGIVAGDIDNDGCVDVFMSGTGFFAGPAQSATVLLHNQCDGTFENIANTANVPGGESALSAAFGDINNDGYIDLFVTAEGHLPFANPPSEQHADKFYLNNGDLTFTEISESAGVDGALGSCVASFLHFNDDEWLDLLVGVCNDVNLTPTPWHVYINNGDNTFEDIAEQTRLDKGGFWMSSAWGDIDNDGDFDLYATNLGGTQTHHLWRNNGDGTFVNIPPDNEDDRDYWAWGATFADFDNDTLQDLYYAGELPGGFPPCTLDGLEQGNILGKGNRGFLFFNEGDGRFQVDNEALNMDLRCHGASGLAKADYDNDGFVDMVIMTSQTREFPVASAILVRNDGNSNNSITIKLVGTDSNAMAIGARIQITTRSGVFQAREIWSGSSFASSESPWPVFGLGSESQASVNVRWPSGLVESFNKLAANQMHTLEEGTGSQ